MLFQTLFSFFDVGDAKFMPSGVDKLPARCESHFAPWEETFLSIARVGIHSPIWMTLVCVLIYIYICVYIYTYIYILRFGWILGMLVMTLQLKSAPKKPKKGTRTKHPKMVLHLRSNSSHDLPMMKLHGTVRELHPWEAIRLRVLCAWWAAWS